MIIENKEALLKEREAAREELASYKCRILVCAGTGCIASGSEKIYQKMVELCQDLEGVSVEFQKDVPHIGTVKTGCQGICELGPLVRIEPYHYQYVKVQEDDCAEIFQRTVLNEEPVERLFYKKGGKAYPTPDEIPFIAKHFNYYSCIAPAAATSEDTTLPMMMKYTNEETVVLSVINGVLCSAVVPVLIPLCYQLKF